MSIGKYTRVHRSPYHYTQEKAAKIVKNIRRYRLGFTPDFASMESKRMKDGSKAWRVVAYKWAKDAAQ